MERNDAPSKARRLNVIGGCGHVGLPLAIAFTLAGHRVCIYDIDREAMAAVQGGKMPFTERDGERLLAEALATGRLEFSSEAASIREADVAILIIGTPVDEHMNPRFSAIKNAMEAIVDHLREGQMLVLRSTVYPGTSEKIRSFLESRRPGVLLSFCPERIAEGVAFAELKSLPQIVSGFSPEAVARASELFRSLTEEIVVLEPLEAELAKIFNNVYRYIKFSIANQFFEIANDYGLDFYRIHHAMTYRYPRSQDFPRAGLAAGPCLFKDTMQLAAFNNNNFFLGHAAMLINEGLPNYVVQKLRERYPLREKVVGILGMAFKAESDDTRESLSFKLKKILEIEAAEVLCTDPYAEDSGFVSAEELVARADVLVLATPHSQYRDLDLGGKPVVDMWNFYGKGGVI